MKCQSKWEESVSIHIHHHHQQQQQLERIIISIQQKEPMFSF